MAQRHHTHHPTPVLRDWGNFASGAHSTAATPPHHTPGSVIRGELDHTQLDLITIEAPTHTVHRTPAHIAHTPQRHIFTTMLTGTSSWTPSDPNLAGHQEFNAGDIGYWTSEVPYRWDFHEPFTLLTLRAPFHAVDILPTTLAPLCGSVFAKHSDLAQYVSQFAEQVLRDHTLLHSPIGSRLVHNLVGLFTTVLAAELQTHTIIDHSQPAFSRVTEFLMARLQENLPLAEIARANDMSPRYVQSLFQKRGTTLSGWLRTRRLEHSRMMLADPARATQGIGAIAHECGFSDHGHFARSFRTAYRVSPSEWRSSVLSDTTEVQAKPHRHPQ